MARRLHVLNPNRSTAMTEAVLAQVRRQLPPGWQALGHTAADGPPVIASRETFEAAASRAAGWPARIDPPLQHGDALLLACFGDPGLEALRAAAAPCPVSGLAEAAVAAAVAARQRFAIVTAGPAWVELLTQRVADFGAAAWLSGVQALPFDGRRLREDPQACRPALKAALQAAERGGAEALILGGAAFAGLDLRPGLHTRLPLIDPVAAATTRLVSDTSRDRHGD
ncbi:MAG: hypothetical protein KBC73_25495 [Burkholderiaceae bacterium]|nr:hypothetical protein [Burkholderiaceae bacterium]